MNRNRLRNQNRPRGRGWLGTLAAGLTLPWAVTCCSQLAPVRAADAPLSGATAAQPAATVRPVPVSLDAVLRLAEGQNPQLHLARARVNEAHAENNLARYSWVPDVYLGGAYYRHEGGIQDQDGRLVRSSTGALFGGLEIRGTLDLREATFQRVNAERKVWQQKGDLSRVTNETLLEAANSYLDLLAARTGEEIARDLEKRQQQLLERARHIAKTVEERRQQAQLQAEGMEAELRARRAAILRLRQQGDAAAARLAYLIGVDPCCQLIPVDERLVPVQLVDATPACCDLVARAQTEGPGVQELEGLINLIQSSIAQAEGPARLLPTVDVYMLEGGFGAGPGARLDWDNRWDLGLRVRWNLKDHFLASRKQEIAHGKLHQAQLSVQELRARLGSGVQEARLAILSGAEQIRLSEAQVRHALEAYKLGDKWLEAAESKPAALPDAVLTLRVLEAAQLAYVNAVLAYDKAQIRLMLLLGPGACHGVLGSAVVGTAAQVSPAPLEETPKPRTTGEKQEQGEK